MGAFISSGRGGRRERTSLSGVSPVVDCIDSTKERPGERPVETKGAGLMGIGGGLDKGAVKARFSAGGVTGSGAGGMIKLETEVLTSVKVRRHSERICSQVVEGLRSTSL